MASSNLLNRVIKYYKGLPHQDAALKFLSEKIPVDLEDQFIRLWRGDYNAINFIRPHVAEFESFRATPYLDRVENGVNIYAYGFGFEFLFERPGVRVQAGDYITRADAEKYLTDLLLNIDTILRGRIPGYKDLPTEAQGVLISFGYNSYAGAYFYGDNNHQTITKNLKNKEYDKIPETLMLYVNPGTEYEVGLKRRRRAEGEMWRKAFNS